MDRFVIYFLILVSFSCKSRAIESLDVNDPKWNWMDDQIEEDFKPFQKSGITLKMINGTMKKKDKILFSKYIKRIQIINGKVHSQDDSPLKLLFENILSIYSVPDIDIIIYDCDNIWNPWILTCPVLGACKMGFPMTVHFPIGFWYVWEKQALTIKKMCENSPWESKTPKIVWRGRNTDAENYNDPKLWTTHRRGKLCFLSQKNPELIDAGFTGVNNWHLAAPLKKDFWKFFIKKPYSSLDEQIKYKYQICLDGNVSTFPGYKWRLLSNCLVFKHDSKFTLCFEKALKPWVHFVPIKSDLSDIFEKLEWVKSHDSEAKTIADNSRQFTKENLMPEHVYLYCYKVLLKWASLQKFKPSYPVEKESIFIKFCEKCFEKTFKFKRNVFKFFTKKMFYMRNSKQRSKLCKEIPK
jgi:hypothetical protein